MILPNFGEYPHTNNECKYKWINQNNTIFVLLKIGALHLSGMLEMTSIIVIKIKIMQYDPIKKSLGKVFNSTPFLRKSFYGMLDLLFLRAWYSNRELKNMAKRSDAPQNILDAGSGYGQHTYRLARIFKKANITGYDIKQEQIDDCNGFMKTQQLDDRVRFEYADLTNFSVEDKFDLIISCDVMEHIEEDVAVFKSFYKTIADNGTLLITTPSDEGDHEDEHGEHHGDAAFIDEHVRDGYSPRDLEEKLRVAGFTNIDIKYTYGTPGKLAWKLSMKWPIQILGASKVFFILLPFYYILTYPWAFVLNYIDTKTEQKVGNGILAIVKK